MVKPRAGPRDDFWSSYVRTNYKLKPERPSHHKLCLKTICATPSCKRVILGGPVYSTWVQAGQGVEDGGVKGGGWSGEDSEGMSLQGQLQTKPRAVWRGSVPLACPRLLYPPECTPTQWSGAPGHRREDSLCHLGPGTGTQEQRQTLSLPPAPADKRKTKTIIANPFPLS